MRIEAPGCTIYVQREPNGGTRVDIVSDGERFADAVASCNVTQLQSKGSVRVDVEVRRPAPTTRADDETSHYRSEG